MRTFRVGDRFMFNDLTPNFLFRGIKGTVIEVTPRQYRIVVDRKVNEWGRQSFTIDCVNSEKMSYLGVRVNPAKAIAIYRRAAGL